MTTENQLTSVSGRKFATPLPPGRRARTGTDAAQSRSHSIRTPDSTWAAFREQTKHDGHTPSYALTLLMTGYLLGHFHLPSFEPAWGEGGEGV